MATVSCIIPAYNEGARIKNVLDVVLHHPSVFEVIVVDDASTDETRKIVSTYARVHYIRHNKNSGKSVAVCTGIRASIGDFIFLLDADLKNLSAPDVSRLIAPVIEDRADVSISLRGNSPWLWRVLGLDYISGERVFHRTLVTAFLDTIEKLPHFGLEVFLNKHIIANRCRLKVVSWPHIASPYKIEKHGRWQGIKGEAKMMLDIFKTISPLTALLQIIKMRKLRVN